MAIKEPRHLSALHSASSATNLQVECCGRTSLVIASSPKLFASLGLCYRLSRFGGVETIPVEIPSPRAEEIHQCLLRLADENYDAAWNLLSDAHLKDIEQPHLQLWAALARSNPVDAVCDSARMEEALERLRRAINKVRHPAVKVTVYRMYLRLLSKQTPPAPVNEISRALRTLEEVVRELPTDFYLEERAHALYDRASVLLYRSCGRREETLTEAEGLLAEARRVFASDGRRLEAAQCDNALGRAYAEQCRKDGRLRKQALNFFMSALRVRDAARFRFQHGQTAHNIADLLLTTSQNSSLEDLVTAAHFAETATSCYDDPRTQGKWVQSQLLGAKIQAQLSRRRDDPVGAERVITTLRSLQAIARSLGDSYLLAEVELELAISLSESTPWDFAEALSWTRSALARFRKCDHASGKMRCILLQCELGAKTSRLSASAVRTEEILSEAIEELQKELRSNPGDTNEPLRQLTSIVDLLPSQLDKSRR